MSASETKFEGEQAVTGGELVKFTEKGTKVEGVLINYEQKQTAKGIGNVYEVRTKTGVAAFFAPSLLHKALKLVPIGNIVSITFLETTKTNAGNPLHHFDVKQAPATPANLKIIGVEIMESVTPVEPDAGDDISDDDLPA